MEVYVVVVERPDWNVTRGIYTETYVKCVVDTREKARKRIENIIEFYRKSDNLPTSNVDDRGWRIYLKTKYDSNGVEQYVVAYYESFLVK